MGGITQRSFNGGELSPQLYGRSDLEKFISGCRTQKNFVCLPHGPVTRRPGTEFIAEVKQEVGGLRGPVLKPFTFSIGQSYMLEFGENYIRFYYNGGQIQDGGSPLEVTTNYADEFQYLVRQAQSADTLYFVCPYLSPNKLVRVSHVNWTFSSLLGDFTDKPTDWGKIYTPDPEDPGTVRASWPADIDFSNDRTFWVGAPADPQKIWGSKLGLYLDFSVSAPLVADDAIFLTLGDKQANPITWILNARKLAVGTTGSENWVTDSAGVGPVSPISKQLSESSAHGSNDVPPEKIGGNVLFLQRNGKSLQEMRYTVSENDFAGDELTLLAEHLTRDYSIVSMAFQKVPYRVLWCVREDGVLLGMTYYPEHKVYGWHQHETEGVFEDVEVIPGVTEDEVWFVIRRTIAGAQRRYIERLAPFFKGDHAEDGFFIDSGLSLDNRQTFTGMSNTNPVAISFGGGPHGLTNGDSVRVRGVEGMLDGDGESAVNRFSFTITIINPNSFSLDGLDGTQLTTYESGGTIAENVSVVSGLDHLDGEEVTVLADGYASTYTVTSGSVTLDEPASIVHAGIPYVSDLSPLLSDPTQQGDDPALTKRVTSVTPQFFKSLGALIGPDEDNLTKVPFVDDNVPTGEVPDLVTGYIEDISFEGEFGIEPTVLIRQDQPLPMTILSVHAEVETGDE